MPGVTFPISTYECFMQKQPPRGVLKKRCSENMQKIYNLQKNTHAEL